MDDEVPAVPEGKTTRLIWLRKPIVGMNKLTTEEDILLLRRSMSLAHGISNFVLFASEGLDDGDAADVLGEPLDHVIRQVAILAIAGLDDARKSGGERPRGEEWSRGMRSVSGTWMQSMYVA